MWGWGRGGLECQETEWQALVGSAKEHPHGTSSINYQGGYQSDVASRQTSQMEETLEPPEFYSLCYQHCVVLRSVLVLQCY